MKLKTVLGKVAGVAPAIVAAVGGPAGPALAAGLSILNKTLLNRDDGPEEDLVEAIKSITPQQSAALYEANLKHAEALRRLAGEDRKDARLLQRMALASHDSFVRRFVYYLAAFWSTVCALYVFGVTFLGVDPSAERFADTALGFMLGTVVAQITRFFFGEEINHSSQPRADK